MVIVSGRRICPFTKSCALPPTMISGVPPDAYSISLLNAVPLVPILTMPVLFSSSLPLRIRSPASFDVPILSVPAFAESAAVEGMVNAVVVDKVILSKELFTLNVPLFNIKPF